MAALLSAAVSCGHGERMQEKFTEIDRMSGIDAQKAMSMLDSIDYGTLSKKERHRYDLLHIKTRDKAYRTHTSDSLVLDVIDYYSDHQKEGLYPEALYYGGRVYSDMGDFPTAIDYFQKALKVIPDDKENLKLKGNILSQTGLLLEGLRLHSQAIQYYEKAVETSRSLNDSTNIAKDWLMLSLSHLHSHDFASSRKDLKEALRYANAIPDEDIAWINVLQSSIFLEEGKPDSALVLIRENLNLVDSTCYNFALANAADTYRLNEIFDTTYIYAKELATSQDFNNRIVGYDIIFSKELIEVLPKDTLLTFISDYKQNIDAYLDRYQSDEALMSHSRYNYELHVKEKIEAEKAKNNLIIIVLALIIIILVSLGIFAYSNMMERLKLGKALTLIQTIFIRMHESGMIDLISNEKQIDSHLIESDKLNELPFYATSKKNILKEKLLSRLDFLVQQIGDSPVIDETLRKHEVIIALNELISNKKRISKGNCLLKDLEDAIHVSCPDFRLQLKILTLDKMTIVEYEVAMLIRAGISPKDMSILLGRTKSAITDRRRSLTKKIFGDSADNHDLDILISNL